MTENEEYCIYTFDKKDGTYGTECREGRDDGLYKYCPHCGKLIKYDAESLLKRCLKYG